MNSETLYPFLHSIAAQYGLPELATARLTGLGDQTIHGAPKALTTGYIRCQPTGQLALMAKALEVRVEIFNSSGICRADVKLTYEHWDGGSNGNAHSFLIFFERRFNNERYAGFVCERTYREANRYIEQVARENQMVTHQTENA